MDINSLIFSLKNRDIVVPQFQREYVWAKEDVKELFRSLLNGFPVGGVLIWRTPKPPALKGMDESETNKIEKVYQVLLDGQQRLTTIYMLATGSIPPYYGEDEIAADPRTLCFNLQTQEFQYFSKLPEDSNWQFVTDILKGEVKWHNIAREKADRYKAVKAISASDIEEKFHQSKKRGMYKPLAFGQIREIIESLGLGLQFRSQQWWHINLPWKSLRVTIDELVGLYEEPTIASEETRIENEEVSLKKLLAFWHTKVEPALKEIPDDYADVDKLIDIYADNHAKLQKILSTVIHVQEIPTNASFSDAIDIFDRINRRGERLTKGELALAHITSKWPEARSQMKDFQLKCQALSFKFNLNFLTRTLVVSSTGRALFEVVRDIERDELVAAWKDVEEILMYIIDILRGEKINSSDLLNSSSVLLPLLYFLKLNGKKLESDLIRRKSIYWVLMANMWGRYSTSQETALEEDLNIIKNSNDNIWASMLGKVRDRSGRLQLNSNDLMGAGTNSRFFTIFYIMLKNRGAIDWFNGLKIDEGSSVSLSTHVHHIFPKAYLKKHGFSEDNQIHLATINEMANLALITGKTNVQISDKAPSEYFKPINEAYPDALEKQLIPDNPQFWKIENFEEFLNIRRRLIAQEINKFFDSYNADISTVSNPESLIGLEESEILEYKETWLYDIILTEKEGKATQNKKLQLACIKTIAAFLNSRGGDLFIGVSNDKMIAGLSRDCELFSRSIDKLQLNIGEVIANSLGVSKKPYYSVNFIKINNEDICHVQVVPCYSGKTWVKFSGDEIFYIRETGKTKSLAGEEADQYWSERLNSQMG